MKRVLFIGAILFGLTVLCAGSLFLWSTSAQITQGELAQRHTYPFSAGPSDRDTFTVMTYNLDHLSGPPHATTSPPESLYTRNLDRATDLLRRVEPDFVGLQDVDFHAARSAYMHQLDSLATRLGYAAGAQATRWNDRYMPAHLTRPAVQSGPVVSGQAVLSRYALRQHVRMELPAQSDWWPVSRPPDLVQVTPADIGGWPLLIMNVELTASSVETREAQARAVNEYYRRLARNGYPIVLIGTFNSPMPSAEGGSVFTDDDTMELLLQGTSLQPALSSESALVTGQAVATFPSPNPTRKVDYIFYRPRLVVPTEAKVWCGRPSPPSNHCAVTLSFLMPRPEDKLPEKRIPDERLPSLESFMRQ